MPALVSTEWLAQHLADPTLQVLDASWYLPVTGRDAREEFRRAHVPGARFFDLDRHADQSSPLPHMLPSAADFAQDMTALGLRDADRVVVYDGSGTNLSAPRAWWMFRVFGHRAVALLDGGFAKWQREGRPEESGEAEPRAGAFSARLDAACVRDSAAMLANVLAPREQVADARSPGRFRGEEPEPRPGLRGGHIPGSHNVPFTSLVNEDGTLKAESELRALFTGAGIDPTSPVTTTCGSGVTACAIVHALAVLGNDRTAVYDGSWSEWGAGRHFPVATGHAE